MEKGRHDVAAVRASGILQIRPANSPEYTTILFPKTCSEASVPSRLKDIDKKLSTLPLWSFVKVELLRTDYNESLQLTNPCCIVEHRYGNALGNLYILLRIPSAAEILNLHYSPTEYDMHKHYNFQLLYDSIPSYHTRAGKQLIFERFKGLFAWKKAEFRAMYQFMIPSVLDSFLCGQQSGRSNWFVRPSDSGCSTGWDCTNASRSSTSMLGS
jgi:hypothetical protein